MGLTQVPVGPGSKTPHKAALSITLRPATLADAPDISSLFIDVFTTTFGHSLSPVDLAEYISTSLSTPAILGQLQNPLVDIIVAVSPADHVVGFVQLTQGTTEPCIADDENAVELQRLYVAQECHGTGAGKVLAAHAEALARERGHKTIWLGVWEENVKAQRLYERLGFEMVGDHAFVMGECVQRDLIMRKSL